MLFSAELLLHAGFRASSHTPCMPPCASSHISCECKGRVLCIMQCCIPCMLFSAELAAQGFVHQAAMCRASCIKQHPMHGRTWSHGAKRDDSRNQCHAGSSHLEGLSSTALLAARLRRCRTVRCAAVPACACCCCCRSACSCCDASPCATAVAAAAAVNAAAGPASAAPCSASELMACSRPDAEGAMQPVRPAAEQSYEFAPSDAGRTASCRAQNLKLACVRLQ